MKAFYQLQDRPQLSERLELRFGRRDRPWVNPTRPGPGFRGLMAIRTGEKRAPQKGEWYLSGAIPEAYRAPNDLTTVFHILRLVATRTELVTQLA